MEWQPIETAPKNKKVLVAYKNALGNWRRVMATFYPAGTLELAEDADETDDGMAPQGWYEECETFEWIKFTDELPTLWHPIPPLPSNA
jgi:hypothetical protein